jgi:hypothetical protein
MSRATETISLQDSSSFLERRQPFVSPGLGIFEAVRFVTAGIGNQLGILPFSFAQSPPWTPVSGEIS